MIDRLQRYLDTLGRVPADDEAADMVRMSRRGFFALGACAVGAIMLPGELPFQDVSKLPASTLNIGPMRLELGARD